MSKIKYFIFLFLCLGQLHAQVLDTDSLLSVIETEQDPIEKIRTKELYASQVFHLNPAEALKMTKENFSDIQDFNEPELEGDIRLTLGNTYYTNGHIDSMKHTYLSALPFFKGKQLFSHTSKAYQKLATVSQLMGQPDSMLVYTNLNFEFLLDHPDSINLAANCYTHGTAYVLKGYDVIAMNSYLRGMRICEAIGYDNFIGAFYNGIAHIKGKLNQFDEALYYTKKSHASLKEPIRKTEQFLVLSNIANWLRKLDRIDEARDTMISALRLAENINSKGEVLHVYNDMALVEYDRNDLKAAKFWAQKTDSLATVLGDDYKKAFALRVLAFISIDESDRPKAKQYIKKAEPFKKDYDDAHFTALSYEHMATLYASVDDYQQAYSALDYSKILRDSLFETERTTRLDELEIIYETEKKDASIKLLQKQTELDATKRQALIAGLILLGIVALSFIYALFQRNKKKQAILSREKAVEAEKRKKTEQQLEFKKKELTAKALQLAKKNEFLQSLELEVADLQSSVDNAVGQTSSKITRMIQRDIVDDEAWDQFGKEFSSVHQEFLNRLREQYGKFTKGEMRLISLLRMNMNSKDIASILGVSDQGVKKARYRLRKKMNLESDDDIQGLIVGL